MFHGGATVAARDLCRAAFIDTARFGSAMKK
jgi:hypothetical protein